MATHHLTDDHIQFLVTDPSADPCGRAVVANFTSIKDATTDHSCIVSPGEHRLINQPSVVMFNKAGIVKVSDLVEGERRRMISRNTQLSPALHQKVLDAFAVSRAVPLAAKRMLQGQGLI